MINRISQSLSYRLGNYDFYRKNSEKLGLLKQDYEALRNNRNLSGGNTVRFNGFETQYHSPYWFLHSIQEIFIDEVYKFAPSRKDARIVDCGANIGLSVLYFKRLCPDARVVAFEPDPGVFKILERNVAAFGLSNVQLKNEAVWVENTTLDFESEGALGGRLDSSESISNRVSVKAMRLRDLMDEPIDFLKIDIEGAEYAVLGDCADKLENVENLFVEYHVRSSEEQQLDEILSWIRKAGFRYYIKAAADNQPHPFITKGGDVYEMQLNISCYRVQSP